MDFIKTSSLRALIELTFQRNWNGFIWMSRKGVIAKRVKTAPDGHIENQRPNAQSGWPRNECSALGQNRSVRLKSRPKSKPLGRSRITTRETLPAVGQATTPRHNRARPKRASRESLAAAQLLAYHGRTHPSEPGNYATSGRDFHRPIHPSDQPPTNHPATTVPTRPRPDCPADRPDRPSERRGRPEAVFEAQSAQFKPKAGADLARLGLAVSYT
ncbi:unnamed protein product [Microthlaspi erraticum]|uniref:Uncharacterized protein n=1 Tax=Microthlaspi erraticum TaxID=1685480 RepID=A0A6D2HK61_9BRAS|nr:unnamed protein product [Microthlaspi erraticum]